MELTLEKIENNPYQNFLDYLGNEQTRKIYVGILDKFLNIIPKEIFEKNLQKTGDTIPEIANLFVELADKDIGLVKQIIHAYVREVKEKKEENNLTNSFIKNQFKPIISLFDANEIDFSWKLINKSIPKPEISKDRSYTIEELNILLLSSNDTVDKLIILLFSSAGFRLGAWDYFTWNDIVFFYNSDGSPKGLGIRVYAGDAEEYWTHGTPEAQKMLLLYREEWKNRFGKYPESSDPLISAYKVKAMSRLGASGVSGRVKRLLERSGLKGINVKRDNGFRKYFNTMCRRAKVFEEDREDMMGHYEGLQKHYERYVEEDFERFTEYQKAISLLTIDDAQRKEAENKKLREEKDKLKLQVNENIKLQAMINAEREARITSQNEIKQMLAKLRDDKLKKFKD